MMVKGLGSETDLDSEMGSDLETGLGYNHMMMVWFLLLRFYLLC
jgi:hypothetical protein